MLGVGAGSIDRLPPHRNPGLEIVFIERGRLRWTIEGRTHVVPPGSVFFTYPWETHGGAEEFEPGHHWHWAWIALRGGGAGREGAARFPASLGLGAADGARVAALLARAPRCLPAGERLPWLIPRLVEERRGRGLAAEAEVSALARLVVLELARLAAGQATGAKDGGDRRVDAFLARLQTECTEPWTLECMAAACRLHRTRFASLVRRQTGDAPLAYLRRLRVRRAQALFAAREDVSVTEVAHACGFASSQHFARIFRRFAGMSAGEFRARQRTRGRGGAGGCVGAGSGQNSA